MTYISPKQITANRIEQLQEKQKREPNYGNKLARQAVKGRIGVCHK